MVHEVLTTVPGASLQAIEVPSITSDEMLR